MSFVFRAPVVVLACIAVSIACVDRASAAPVVWTGPTLTFSKASSTDPLLPENQDRLTDNIQLTRNDIKGLLNAALDCDASGCTYSDNSPMGTEWATELQNSGATISVTNWAALNFVDWEVAYGDQGSLQNNITFFPAVVHLIADDIYLDLKFTQWGAHSGGSFTYERSTPVPEPATFSLALAGLLSLAALIFGRRRRPGCHGADAA
jgi:MYXO-CTERM domain-containing protein